MHRFRMARGDDTGASLILAIAFIAGVSLVTAGLLSFATSSTKAAKDLRQRAQADYIVDAALQTAINTLRRSTYNNATGEVCLGTQNYIDVPFPFPDGTEVKTRVFCSPATGSGAAAGLVPISAANKPGSAILTLGTNAGESGIGLGSNGTLSVKGEVRTNTNITRGGSSSTLQMIGGTSAFAKQACPSDLITPAAANRCSYTPTSTDANYFLDPANVTATSAAYAQPATSVTDLIYRAVPACGASPITFQPGYYDDAVKLSALTNGGCAGKTLWFKPGQYFFDFHNKEGGGGLTTGADVWSVSDANTRVVAGTPSGWTTSPFTAPSIPGSCVSPLTSTTGGQGVQFAFGGDSRLSVTAGQVEVCGQYYDNRPSLAVYGIKSGANPSVTTFTGKTNGTGTTPAGSVAFSPFSALTERDGTGASAALVSTTGGTRTASVSTTDFSTAALPGGSMATTSAQLVIRHRETVTSGSLASVTASGSIDTGGTATAVAATNLTIGSAWHDDTVPVTLSAATVGRLHDGTAVLSQARLDATVNKTTGGVQNNATIEVDSIQLVLNYKPPAVRGEQTDIAGTANCIGTAPSSANCALITTSGAQARLYFQGTSYSPLAALDITLTNVSSQVFRAGLIARSLAIKVTASSTYTGPVIELPDNSPGFASAPLQVYLTATPCASSCPSSATAAAGRAKVAFTDTTISPVPGQRQVTVNSWQATTR